MNCRVQHALVILAATALPALVHAGDPEMIAKRAARFAPQRRGESFRSMETAYPFHVIKRGGTITKLPRAPRKLDVTYTFADKQHTLDDLLTRSRTQGFLGHQGWQDHR